MQTQPVDWQTLVLSRQRGVFFKNRTWADRGFRLRKREEAEKGKKRARWPWPDPKFLRRLSVSRAGDGSIGRKRSCRSTHSNEYVGRWAEHAFPKTCVSARYSDVPSDSLHEMHSQLMIEGRCLSRWIP
ncbi:hypothetical protein AVEN_156420-1 [Araneus ventricosus]|uniref:Uncharacterized protein n=1 Tax=Araneus ventricosus TaxID=182803 RepID=A0A4Y2SZH0_ARAVE|nr:hypothetical protein AVEN_156420-1 [Araneus ventricosus]